MTGGIPADKTRDQSNTMDNIPIPVSEEQAVDNTAEIQENIIAPEEQSEDNNLDSEATDSLVPVEEGHYKQKEPSSDQTQPTIQDGE